jgi:hypothetical protein
MVVKRSQGLGATYSYVDEVTKFLLKQKSKATGLISRYSLYAKKEYSDFEEDFNDFLGNYDKVRLITENHQKKLIIENFDKKSILGASVGILIVLLSYFPWDIVFNDSGIWIGFI